MGKGISEEEVDSIVQGELPGSMDEEGRAVWEAASELVNSSGPLSRTKWDRLVQLFSKDGATHLVQTVAFYCYVCVILNGFDVQVPAEK